MYWFVLALFLIGSITPLLSVGTGVGFDAVTVRSLIALCIAALFALVYLVTDRARRAALADYRAVQRAHRDAQRDLQAAYAHIGETNRRIDIITDVAAAVFSDHSVDDLCTRFARAAAQLVRTDHIALCVLHARRTVYDPHGMVQYVHASLPHGTVIQHSDGTEYVLLHKVYATYAVYLFAPRATVAADAHRAHEALLRVMTLIFLHALMHRMHCTDTHAERILEK